MRLVIPTLFLSVYSFITPKSHFTNTITTKINTNNKLYLKRDDDKDDPDDIEDSGFLDYFNNNKKENIEKLGWKTTENNKDDLVEKFAQLMGFESYEKWKAVRFTIYALVAGYLLADLKDEIVANLNNPFSNL